MTKTVLWSSSAGDVPANLAFTNNFAATTNPGVGNDITQGYTAGSQWINTSTSEVFDCISSAAGAAVWVASSTGTNPGQVVAPAGQNASVTGGVAGTSTAAGGNASLVAGAGGSTSGAGGNALVTGGAGSGGNANGGDVTIAGGAANGSGVNGVVRENGVVFRAQGAPGTLNASATLTAALMLTGIVTTTSASAVAATLDVATNLDTALPSSGASDSFDFSIINTGPNTLTVGTASGWTLVGTMTVVTLVSGRFRARKTGGGAWVLYRL